MQETDDQQQQQLRKDKQKEAAMTVRVKCPSIAIDTDLQFPLDERATVAELKRRLFEAFDVPADKQRIIYAGKILSDDQLELTSLLPSPSAGLASESGGGIVTVHLVVSPVYAQSLSQSSSRPPQTLTGGSSRPVASLPSSSSATIQTLETPPSLPTTGIISEPSVVYIDGLPYLAVPESMLHSRSSEPPSQTTPPLERPQINQPQLQPPQNNVRIHVIRLSPRAISALWTLAKLSLFIYLFSHNASTLRLSLMLGMAAVVFLNELGVFQNLFHNQRSMGGMVVALGDWLVGGVRRLGPGVSRILAEVVVPLFATLVPGLDVHYRNVAAVDDDRGAVGAAAVADVDDIRGEAPVDNHEQAEASTSAATSEQTRPEPREEGEHIKED